MHDRSPEAALRSLRLAGHLSLTSLAERARLPLEQLAALEAGAFPFDVHVAERLAWALGVAPERLALAGHGLESFASVVRTLAERSALSLDAVALRAGLPSGALEASVRPWAVRGRAGDGVSPAAPLEPNPARAVAEALGIEWFTTAPRPPWARTFWVLLEREGGGDAAWIARALEVDIARRADDADDALEAVRDALERAAEAGCRAPRDDHPFDRPPADEVAWRALRVVTRSGERRSRASLRGRVTGVAVAAVNVAVRAPEVRAQVRSGVLVPSRV